MIHPSFESDTTIATNLLVPGRGHELGADGQLELTESATQRVGAAALYFKQHEEAFRQAAADGTGGVIVMSGGYAKLASAGRMHVPPLDQREAVLMAREGVKQGIPAEYIRQERNSTSTMENWLRTREAGYFPPLSSANPVGIPVQETQYGRLAYFGTKIFGLPPEAMIHIEAPGELDEKIAREEQKLLRITKIAYRWANTPRQLRQVESVLGVAATMAERLKLQKSPANSYIGPATPRE